MRRIAVDLDGVLANTMESCCKIINSRHSTNFTVPSFNRWKAWETAEISKDEFFHSLDEAWFDWQTIPPTEEKLAEKVEKLVDFGKVDIVTARSSETVGPAKAWLRDQGIRFKTFVRTDSGIDKVELNYDIFIDDSPEVISALASKPNGHAVLYNQPWNREIEEMPNIRRAYSWDEIPELVLRTLEIK